MVVEHEGKYELVNLLRLELTLPLWKEGSLEAATIHVAKTNACIIDNWQTFSNIEGENDFAAIAVLGYMHMWKNVRLFAGVRNVNENFSHPTLHPSLPVVRVVFFPRFRQAIR